MRLCDEREMRERERETRAREMAKTGRDLTRSERWQRDGES